MGRYKDWALRRRVDKLLAKHDGNDAKVATIMGLSRVRVGVIRKDIARIRKKGGQISAGLEGGARCSRK